MKTFHHQRISALCCILLLNISTSNAGKQFPKENFAVQDQRICFTENKGQINGYDDLPHPEVKFVFQQGGTQLFFLEDGISYQFTKIHYPQGYQELHNKSDANHWVPELLSNQQKIRTETFRMDMTLVGANKKTMISTEGKSHDYVNFYTHNVLAIHSYTKIIYHDVYPGIDWVIYAETNSIKYDFVVRPGANPSLIKMKFSHQEGLVLNKDGSFTLKNSLGEISEKKPVSSQNGEDIPTYFKLENDVISFQLGKYNANQNLIIDPTLVWGTYYGSAQPYFTKGTSCTTDSSGNVYLSGHTNSINNIASAGHQNTIGGGSPAFLVKFNSMGVRLWATYYGGSNWTGSMHCSTDLFGNVYLVGVTSSTNNIASGGHQNFLASSNGDAFIVKFNTAGLRLWASYYGGEQYDRADACTVDTFGNVYVAGVTDSQWGISSGGHQNTHSAGLQYGEDAFLVKFNSNGIRQWATYYGGSNGGTYASCTTDFTGNVYLAGTTSKTFDISSAGHQSAFGGYKDAFLVKFNTNGVRAWGTYYGGISEDAGQSCATDPFGNIYLAGWTWSSNNISLSGHQNNLASGMDAYLVQFNSQGQRQWGTYYGGNGDECPTYAGNVIHSRISCATDTAGYVYLAGTTQSTNNIASGGFQNSFGGGPYDTFLAKFNTLGIRHWGTYYGGTNYDDAAPCAVSKVGDIYISGTTASPNNIALWGHQTNYYFAMLAFLAKISNCVIPPSPVNATLINNLTICNNGTTTLSATGTGTVYWYASPVSMQSIGTGTTFVTSNLGLGTYSFYASNYTCAHSASRTLITVTVSSTPTVFAISTNSTNCAGQNVTLGANGANSYTWYPGGLIGLLVNVSPSVTTNYTVFGSSGSQCFGSAVVIQSVVPAPSISVNSGTLCSGHIFTIVPNGANTYTIEGGSALVSPTTNASYTVIGGINNGCISANVATCNITVLPSPTVSASASSTLICPGQPVTLSGIGGISFTWTPGIPLTGIVNPSSSINYSFTASGSNSCETTAIITISVDACTGIESRGVDQANVILYPNPNQGSFTIQAGEPAEIKIFNTLGQIVYQSHLKQGSQSITFNHVAKGIYLVKIETKQKVQTLRWIKE